MCANQRIRYSALRLPVNALEASRPEKTPLYQPHQATLLPLTMDSAVLRNEVGMALHGRNHVNVPDAPVASAGSRLATPA